MKKDRWVGYKDKWSNKKREDKWFPNRVEDFLIAHIVDSTNAESTSVYLQYDDKTNKIYRIKNIGGLSNKQIVIKFTNRKRRSGWVRRYVISPDKDGVDQRNIDLFLAVSNFPLIHHEGNYKLDDETTFTITVEDI